MPGTSSLADFSALAREAGREDLAREAEVLDERVSHGRFYVAFLGQFKRGKSTLINALLGRPVLPSGVLPVTSIVTVVRHGPDLATRVRLLESDWIPIDPSLLGDWVSEEGNPGNQRGVEAVEVSFPGSLLESGMCLVDTPGLGSVFGQATAATHAFLPHLDAAVVVLGADPPISEEELSLSAGVMTRVRDVLFVLNKADRATESDRAQVREFTARVLMDRGARTVGRIFQVSALERLEGRPGGPEWQEFEGALSRLASGSGSTLAEEAARRGVRLLTGRLARELEEARDALLRPIEDSERRVAHLRRTATDAERTLGDLGHLLSAEEDRLREEYARHKEAFLASAEPEASQRLLGGLRESGLRGPRLRDRAFVLAQEESRRVLDRWRAEEQPKAEALYGTAARRFVELANTTLSRLAGSGDQAFGHLPRSVGAEMGFRIPSRLHFTELLGGSSGTPAGWVIDQFRARKSLERFALRYQGELLTANASRIENDSNDRVHESRLLLERQLRSILSEVYSSAERALEAARKVREVGQAGVDRERSKLERLIEKVRHVAGRPENGSGQDSSSMR